MCFTFELIQQNLIRSLDERLCTGGPDKFSPRASEETDQEKLRRLEKEERLTRAFFAAEEQKPHQNHNEKGYNSSGMKPESFRPLKNKSDKFR